MLKVLFSFPTKKRLQTWWKSIHFDLNISSFLTNDKSFLAILTRLFLLIISCLSSFCWHCRYVFLFIENSIQSKTRQSSLFEFKGSIHKYLYQQLVYKLPFSCYNSIYYGETERHLLVRVSSSGNHSTDTETG